MKRKVRAFICVIIMLMSGALYNYDGNIQASTLKYVKLNTNYIMKDKYGFTKLTVNGSYKSIRNGVKSFKFKLKYEGKYVVKTVNKKGQKKTTIFYVDGTKPQIKCVTSGNKITVTVKDDRKLSQVLLNGKKVKSKFTIATAGNYKIEAKDKAGNKIVRTIKVGKSEVKETEVPVTEIPVTEMPVTPTPYIPEMTTEPTPNISQVTDTPTATPATAQPEKTDAISITMEPDDSSKGQLEDCSHIWNTSILLEPTCEKDGVERFDCSLCGKIKYETLPMKGHNFVIKDMSEKYKVKEETCTTVGIYYYACKNCGEKSDLTYEVPKLGHDFIEKIDEKALIEEATCVQGARYYKICSRCSELSDEIWNTTELLNHQYNTKKILSEPTQISDRSYELCCGICGKSNGQIYYEEGTHLDTKVPHVYGTAYLGSLNHTTYSCVVDSYYHAVKYSGSLSGRNYEYYSYLQNVVPCTDPLGISFHACAIDEESGIKQYQIATLNVTSEQLEEINKNDTQEYIEKLINNYLSTGLMMSNAQNISGGSYVNMLAPSGMYEYMLILVEDMAGNITVVSTEAMLF